MATDFGSDISTVPTLDPSFATLTGPHVLSQALLRRFTTPLGSLVDDPTYGLDIREYLNTGINGLAGAQGAATLAQMKQDMESQAVLEEDDARHRGGCPGRR
jgi:hypothetical protein